MFEVVLALASGILIGRLGRRFNMLKRTSNLLTGWGVVALLFCMGLGIGSNPQVLQSLPTLGGQALVLSLAAICGGFLCSLPLSRWLKRNHTQNSAEPSEDNL